MPYRVEKRYSDKYYDEPYKGSLGPSVDGKELADFSRGKRKRGPKDLAWIKALYKGEVTYHDVQLGRFLKEAERLGALEDTLIVVTNDHGEELDDHGRLGHGHSLYEELIRAPLIMHFPERLGEGRVIDDIVEQVDLTPTLLDVLGVPQIPGVDGKSVMPLLDGRGTQQPMYAMSEFLSDKRTVVVGHHKLHASRGFGGKLMNLKDDPGENDNIAKAEPIAWAMCEIHAGEAFASPDKKQRLFDLSNRKIFQAGEANIDPATRKQLEALGYFGD